MRILQRLLRQPLLLLLLVSSAKAALPKWGRNGGTITCNSIRPHIAFGFAISVPHETSCGSGNNSSRLYSRGRFRIHPRLRVRRLSRDSGGSHLLELARQRLLLERDGSIDTYLRAPLRPFPVDGEVHSQRKRTKNPPPWGPPSGPLQLERHAKQLLRKHSGTRNNRRVLLLRDRLRLLQEQLQQQQQLSDSSRPGLSLLRKLWDVDEGNLSSQEHQHHEQQKQQQRQHELANARLLCPLSRPLGSRRLFVCGVDLRVTATDFGNMFQTITEGPVTARLKRGKDGRHLGFGSLEFHSVLDATRCLAEFNGIKVGNSTVRLAELMGPAGDRSSFPPHQQQQQQYPQQQQQQLEQEQKTNGQKGLKRSYFHPYPLPCE